MEAKLNLAEPELRFSMTIKTWPECEVHAFQNHLTNVKAIAERLKTFYIVTCMRERTPFGRDLLERLPNLCNSVNDEIGRRGSLGLQAALVIS